MTTSEQFSDDAMQAFFDTELQKQAETTRKEQERNIVHTRLWEAAERLEMELAVGIDPATHGDDFTALIKEITEIVSSLPEISDPTYSRADHVRTLANQEWDSQLTMLSQIASALNIQMYGSLPASEKALIKKQTMARILVIGEGHEQWLALVDEALEGDALDPLNPEDFEFISQALEVTANAVNSPEIKLYDSILVLLGVPSLDEDIPDDYDMDELELLTHAAREIAEAAFCRADRSEQPDRHSMINEVIQAYCLVDDVDLTAIIELADSYAELKSSQ